MTPPRESQGMNTTPPILSCLSNSISKKWNLQPVSTLVKDIVTKYATNGSKSKNLKSDAHLIKDLLTGKVMTKVATYKNKDESK